MSIRERIARAMRHRDKAVCETGTYEEYADAALAEIAKDHVVVPRVPTEAMIYGAIGRKVEGGELYASIYTAMIEATGEE